MHRFGIIASRASSLLKRQSNRLLRNSSISRMLSVLAIPALEDNYMYLIVDTDTNEAAIVDPVEPDKVLEIVAQKNVKLGSVLTTHHHWDHAGGNANLIKKRSDLRVFGGDDRIDGVTQMVKHDDTFKIGNLNVQCLFTPCHTNGHICYFVTENGGKKSAAVFTGDTLFSGGCGRFFEGTAEQMFRALVEILANLPEETDVYCGHEYTVKNLQFATMVEPDNKDAADALVAAKEKRKNNEFTIPSTIGKEKRINPFMRVSTSSALKARAKTDDPIKVMAYIRKEKDEF